MKPDAVGRRGIMLCLSRRWYPFEQSRGYRHAFNERALRPGELVATEVLRWRVVRWSWFIILIWSKS